MRATPSSLIGGIAAAVCACSPGIVEQNPDASDVAGDPDGAPPEPADAAIPRDPDAAAPPPDAGQTCPSGATCFSVPGLVHAPTPGHEVLRVSFEPPVGSYRSIQLELVVYHGGWAPDPDAKRHNIFWLAHNKRNRDLYGYVNFVRPNVVLLRHGIDQEQGVKAKLTDSTPLPADRFYELSYLYDVVDQEIVSTVTSGAELVSELADVPNTDTIYFGAGKTIDIDFGFPGGENIQEPATYGWEYRDLRIVLTP